MKLGMLTKAAHDFTLRFNPALVIKEEEVIKACNVIQKGIRKLEALNKERKRELKGSIKKQEDVTVSDKDTDGLHKDLDAKNHEKKSKDRRGHSMEK
jgi:hypothetical protein